MSSGYEIFIGLEIHGELRTKTKAFCSCSTVFGAPPNKQVCPGCLGMPGTLPVLNRAMVEMAVDAGLALNCTITPNARFDRKHYVYPDLPKAYQVSQLYLPLCRDGHLDLLGKRVRIREIHMEEDAGKLIHDPWSDSTWVDYNRGGMPLIEIVTEPDLRTPEEVVAFVSEVRGILQAVGACDGKMQEGSLRADVNLSVRPVGTSVLGTRTEMKNLNSLKSIVRAVAGESRRQIERLEMGKPILQETRRWDDNKDTSFAMRSKEDAQDYRYFPDPDFPPLCLDPAWIQARREGLPELPEGKRARYPREYGLSAYDTEILVSERSLSALFESATALGAPPKEAANWIMGEVLALLKSRGETSEELRLSPEKLTQLIQLQAKGRINRNAAREILAAVLAEDIEIEAYIQKQGLTMVSDEDFLRRIVEEVLRDHKDSLDSYLSGKEKALGFLMGQAMARAKGKANPALLKETLLEAITAKNRES